MTSSLAGTTGQNAPTCHHDTKRVPLRSSPSGPQIALLIDAEQHGEVSRTSRPSAYGLLRHGMGDPSETNVSPRVAPISVSKSQTANHQNCTEDEEKNTGLYAPQNSRNCRGRFVLGKGEQSRLRVNEKC